MNRQVWVNLFIILAVVGAYAALKLIPQGEDQIPTLNDLAAKIQLQSYDPNQKLDTNISRYQGKPLVVNFWAKGCTGCDREKATLAHFWHKYGSEVQMMGVTSLAAGHDKENPYGYDLFFDPHAKMAETLGVEALPQTLLFDREGNLLKRYTKPITGETKEHLEATLAELQAISNLDRTQVKVIVSAQDVPLTGALTSFELTDSNGKAFALEHLSGKVWVANFVFTSCDSVCPLLTQKMKKINQSLSASLPFHSVSISVDPETDTPEVLRAYMKRQKVDPTRWSFLTGDWEVIKDLMANQFKIGSPDQPMFHSAKFALIDQRFNIRGFYDSDSAEEMEDLKRNASRLLGLKVSRRRAH